MMVAGNIHTRQRYVPNKLLTPRYKATPRVIGETIPAFPCPALASLNRLAAIDRLPFILGTFRYGPQQ